MASTLLIFLLLLLTTKGDIDEVSTLNNLKQQLGNPSAMEGWTSSSSSPCNWFGVQCINDTVVSLNLSNINISVPLPGSICDLKNLVYLNLAYNNIVGGFPKVLYNCSHLQYLDISQNFFDGEIPHDIDNLSSLRYLDAGSNGFAGSIPSTLGNMAELRVLRLHSNAFNGTFPKEISKLQNLEELLLAFNAFVSSEIPTEYGTMKSLQYLWMRRTNLIGSIPDSFRNLSGLKHLDLVDNQMVGEIPEGLFRIKNLTYLYLYRNKFSGGFPQKLDCLNLMEIDVSDNNLTGRIPEAFGNLTRLTIIHMSNNHLTGEVPASLGLLPSLRNFRVFGNNLSGVLPPEMGFHSQLAYFEISSNRFSGELPQNLCAGGALKGVDAFSNNLKGNVPKSLSDCPTLKSIQLSGNNMSGEIPSGIWSSSSLESLMVRWNTFSGCLPSIIGSNMSWVDVSDNKLTGTIPRTIANWKKLTVFHASNNQLSGEIPEAATELSSITDIRMDGNNLSGVLPKKIISWNSLYTLNLSRNNIKGEIPESLGFLPVLTYLDLSLNQLSGIIPSQLGNLKLPYLNLSANQLSGKIPGEFDSLAYETSFLDNPGLCTATARLDLPKCINTVDDSNKLSTTLIVVIVVVAVALVLFLVIVILARVYKRQNLHNDKKNWNLTSFQRLNFSERKVLESLSDINIIGRGGSGQVYRVQIDQSGEQFVAVKRIWVRQKIDYKLEKEFASEVQVLGTLKHTNIVKLLCCISSDDSKLLVYEYLENTSLDRWLHDKKRMSALWSNVSQHRFLNWPTRLRIATGAAQGLCYMHHDCSPPIIHRDIKSGNILLDSDFKAKIADFGLAKMLTKEGEARTVSIVIGSVGYLAPEYSYTTRVTEKVDVYSFGVVLLELVTGREPGDGGGHSNLAEWAWKQFIEGIPIANCLDEEIKELGNLEEMTVIFKLGLLCTCKSPSARPSMSEVMQILKRFSRSTILENNRSELDVSQLLTRSGSTSGSCSYLSSYGHSEKVDEDGCSLV